MPIGLGKGNALREVVILKSNSSCSALVRGCLSVLLTRIKCDE